MTDGSSEKAAPQKVISFSETLKMQDLDTDSLLEKNKPSLHQIDHLIIYELVYIEIFLINLDYIYFFLYI